MIKLLEELYENLLIESVDMSTPDTIIRALERGQITGVSKNAFLPSGTSMESAKLVLSRLISTLNNSVSANDFNRYMILFMQKAKTINVLNKFDERELREILDGFKAYFGNTNKKEVKENEEIKQRFEKFPKETLSVESVKEFEQWANTVFVEKARMKRGEAQIIYNKNGWEIIAPKTFAAAKEYACMNGRKAQWCTSAQSRHFDEYTNNGADNIYIIRNKEKDKMFQMDFGNKGEGSANFKNESDMSVSINELKKSGVPDELLATLKSKQGKSIKDSIEEFRKKGAKEKRAISVKTKDLTGWENKRFSSIAKFKQNILYRVGGSHTSMTHSITFKDDDGTRIVKNSNTVERALSGKTEKKIILGKIEKEGETYFYAIPSSGKVMYKDEEGDEYSSDSYLLRIIEDEEGNKKEVKIIREKDFASINIPNSLKQLLLNKNLRTKENKNVEIKKEPINQVKKEERFGSTEVIIKDIKSLNTIFNADISEREMRYIKNMLAEVSIKDIVCIIVKDYDIIMFLKNGIIKYNSEARKEFNLYEFSRDIREELYYELSKYNVNNIKSLQSNVVRAIYFKEEEALIKRVGDYALYYNSNINSTSKNPGAYFFVRDVSKHGSKYDLGNITAERFIGSSANKDIAEEVKKTVRPYYAVMKLFHSEKEKENFYRSLEK
jgi:hypothetical protein